MEATTAQRHRQRQDRRQSGRGAKDNVCAFGQWLHGPSISAATRASADFATVRRLHADFHKCAARVLAYASGGQKAEADALMAGEYTRISADLTAAMLKWRAASH